MNEIILLMLFSVAIASCIAAVFGFGEAMLLIPILASLVGIQQAVPLVSLFALIVNISISIKDWRFIQFRSMLPLLGVAVCFVPLGVYVLSNVQSPIFKYILGGIIILFALYKMLIKKPFHLKSEIWALPFGAVAGAMGGAYNIAGPPVVVFANLRGWNPATFRASLQGFFAPLSVIIVINHGITGNYTTAILTYFAWGVPALLVGMFVGNWLHYKIQQPERFQSFMNILLILLGTALFI